MLVARLMKSALPAVFAAITLLGAAYFSYRDGKVARVQATNPVEDSAPAAEQPEEDSAEDEAPAAVDNLPTVPPASEPGSLRRFSKMPDGTDVPALPSQAPQRIKVGIALFRYKGAQGPPSSPRTRAEAEKLALEAQKKGQDEFAAAIKMADRGSAENIGWLKRGVLEPAVEYAAFTTDKGKLAKQPIDTPRGFWVLRRIR